MKPRTFFYNVRQGVRNIWRNKMFSIASIATMAACIFLFGVFYSIGVNFRSMVQTAETGVAVTVFFDENTPQATIDTIGQEIATRPEVDSYKFVSAEEAWANFQQEYFADSPDAAEGFANDNPLANSANYEIYLKDVSQQDTLVAFLEGLDGVREVHRSETTAKTLSDFNNLITFVSTIIVAILIGVSVFLISNTVTVGISVRKEEIAIMKLIGAKDNFVRAPFVVEGVMIGFIGSVIPLVIIYFLYHRLIVYVTERFSALSSMMTFVPVGAVFRVLLPVSLVLGVGIGYVGSRLTLKRHLNV